jgi:hypothetical protein
MRPPLARVEVVSTSILDPRLLAEEFPTVRATVAHVGAADDVLIDADEWRTSGSFRAFDDAVEQSGSETLRVRGDGDVIGTALEVLTRYQRHVGRRNFASKTPAFDLLLRAHRALHDTSKPLVKADLDHAIDTWQWMLRLDPSAGVVAQLAALFHDIERLESEADARIEQHAPDYQAFKNEHARRGGERAEAVLREAGFGEDVAARVRDLVAGHERRGAGGDLDLLNDADALSFFSLNSAGYIDYFGLEQTRKKIRYTLGRLGASARRKLAWVRFRPDVHALFLAAAA